MTAMHDDTGGTIVIEDAALAGGFVQVPAVVYFDKRLRDGAVRVYGALLWYAWRMGHFPGQRAMAADLGAGESTIRRHLSDLQQAGYVEAVRVGNGLPNKYVIKSLQTVGRDTVPDRSKSSGHLTAQNRAVHRPLKIERSYRVVESRDVKDKTLSPPPATSGVLSDAFFVALRVAKPSRKQRERANQIIMNLTAEGYDNDDLHEAFLLAAERGARGADLLPHVIGEAHARVEERRATQRRAEQVAQVARQTEAEARERARETVAAIEALSPGERERWEAAAREALGLSADRHNGMGTQMCIQGWIAQELQQVRMTPKDRGPGATDHAQSGRAL